MAHACYRCQTALEPGDFGRAARCTGCGFDVRVCRNCLHYDAGAYNHCREPMADRVLDAEKANFCDYFKPATAGACANSQTPPSDARQRAEALFKKS